MKRLGLAFGATPLALVLQACSQAKWVFMGLAKVSWNFTGLVVKSFSRLSVYKEKVYRKIVSKLNRTPILTSGRLNLTWDLSISSRFENWMKC